MGEKNTHPKKTDVLLIPSKEKFLEVGTETSEYMLGLTSENKQDNMNTEINDLKIYISEIFREKTLTSLNCAQACKGINSRLNSDSGC